MNESMREIITEDVNIHSAAKIGYSSIYPTGNKYASGDWTVVDWNNKRHFFDGRQKALDFFFTINNI